MRKVYIRADDIEQSEVLNYFVAKDVDRKFVDELMSQQPVLLVGSRGTGKTMLLRVAHRIMSDSFKEKRVLPVYLSLSSSQFIDENELRAWMLYKVLLYLNSELRTHGFNSESTFVKSIRSIEKHPVIGKLEDYMATLSQCIDSSPSGDKFEIDGDAVIGDADSFKLFASELCAAFGIKKIVLLFDEACQSFRPEQQRIFFNLFKDLRSPNIVCKAAVYPGLVSYGNFQAAHDALEINISRDILSDDYIPTMREIVQKYFSDDFDVMEKHGDELDCIIACATGNPRFLIKTIELILGRRFSKSKVTEIIREYYRDSLRSEHIKLTDRYAGHSDLIGWGYKFIEDTIIPTLQDWNGKSTDKTTLFFGIERSTPVPIIHALKILEYSGIIVAHSKAVKYRDSMYDRYYLNMGIYISSDANPVDNYKGVFKNLNIHHYPTKSPRDFFNSDKLRGMGSYNLDTNKMLNQALSLPTTDLEISSWTKGKLTENGYTVVQNILDAKDDDLKKIYYIGNTRSAKIRNEAYNAIIEYISG